MKKSVENFQSSGGRHCITQAMKQIFAYYGHPLSEEMLFGLGEGLDFTYINLTHSLMVSGRSKVLEFEEVLSRHLGIEITCRKNKDNHKIFEKAKSIIDNDQPVLIYADMQLYYMAMMMNRNVFMSATGIIQIVHSYTGRNDRRGLSSGKLCTDGVGTCKFLPAVSGQQ